VRRNIFLALVAALALAVGLSNVAVAHQGGADASAKAGKKGKRGKGKAKTCKGKRGKARKRCQRRRGGGANWLKIGKYKGQGGVEIEIRSRKRFRLTFPTATTCLTPLGPSSLLESQEAELTANKLTGGYKAKPGELGPIRYWSLTVTSGYRYKLVVSSNTSGFGPGGPPPCDKPGVKFEGKLKKVG